MEIPANVLMNLKTRKETPEEIEQRKQDTARKAKKRKQQNWLKRDPDKYERTLGILQKEFPLAFSPYKPPLMKQIYAAIRGRTEITARDLQYTLNRYTKSFDYLKSLRSGGQRLDLDGNEVEAVTSDEQQFAREELQRQYDRLNSRKNRK